MPDPNWTDPMRGTSRGLRWYARAQGLGAALSVLVATFFYLLCCRPTAARARAMEAQVRQARADLAIIQFKVNQLPRLRQEVARLGASIDSFHRQLPIAVDPSALIRGLAEAARQIPLRKLTCQPEPPRALGDVHELPLAVGFEADFFSACTFLRQLEDAPQLSRVRNLRVRARGAKAGRVEVQLAMSVYYAEP